MLTVEEIQGHISLDDGFSGPLTLVSSKLSDFGKHFDSVFGGAIITAGVAVGAIAGVTAAIVSLGERGSDINDVSDTLDHFAGSTQNAAAIMENLRSGTKGQVDDFDLMKEASHLLSAQVKLSADDFGTLGQAAFVLQNRGLGGTKEMLDLVSNALVTGRTRSLAMALGVIDNTHAQDDYARSIGRTAEQLSPEQKLIATRITIMGMMNSAVKDAGKLQLDFGELINAGRIGIKNWWDDLARGVASSPAVMKAVNAIGGAIQKAFGDEAKGSIETILGWINKFADKVTQYGPVLVEWASKGVDAAKKYGPIIADWLSKTITYLTDVAKTVEKTWNALPDWFQTAAKTAAMTSGAVLLVGDATVTAGSNMVGFLANIATMTSGTLDATKAMGSLAKAMGIGKVFTLLDSTLTKLAVTTMPALATSMGLAEGATTGFTAAIGRLLLAIAPYAIILAGLAYVGKTLWDAWHDGNTVLGQLTGHTADATKGLEGLNKMTRSGVEATDAYTESLKKQKTARDSLLGLGPKVALVDPDQQAMLNYLKPVASHGGVDPNAKAREDAKAKAKADLDEVNKLWDAMEKRVKDGAEDLATKPTQALGELQMQLDKFGGIAKLNEKQLESLGQSVLGYLDKGGKFTNSYSVSFGGATKSMKVNEDDLRTAMEKTLDTIFRQKISIQGLTDVIKAHGFAWNDFIASNSEANRYANLDPRFASFVDATKTSQSDLAGTFNLPSFNLGNLVAVQNTEARISAEAEKIGKNFQFATDTVSQFGDALQGAFGEAINLGGQLIGVVGQYKSAMSDATNEANTQKRAAMEAAAASSAAMAVTSMGISVGIQLLTSHLSKVHAENKAIQDLKDEIIATGHDLPSLIGPGGDHLDRKSTLNALKLEYDQITRNNDATAYAAQLAEKVGLTWQDKRGIDGLKELETHADALAKDMTHLALSGYSWDQVVKGYAPDLENIISAAMDMKQALPESLAPFISQLLTSGHVSDELKRKLLGMAEAPKVPFADMEATAKELGIDIGALGEKFSEAKFADETQKWADKWHLLVDNGADINAVIDAMKDKTNDYVHTALKFGTEVPASMRPMLEAMAKAGKLTDENGDKLDDLSRINFAPDIEKDFDDLIKKLTGPDGLIDSINKLITALGDLSGVNATPTVTVHHKDVTDPSAPSSPPEPNQEPDSDGDGKPDSQDNWPDNPLLFRQGTRGRYLNFGAGTPVVLHGRERVMTEMEGAVTDKAGRQDAQQTIVVQIGDEVIARSAVRGMPRQLKIVGGTR